MIKGGFILLVYQQFLSLSLFFNKSICTFSLDDFHFKKRRSIENTGFLSVKVDSVVQ